MMMYCSSLRGSSPASAIAWATPGPMTYSLMRAEPDGARVPVDVDIVRARRDVDARVLAGSGERVLVGVPCVGVRVDRRLGDLRRALHALLQALQATQG